MRIVRLTLAYDGSGFRGWAAQRDRRIRTIEGVLTGILSEVLLEDVRLSVAGRTDAGVHAKGQVVSFVTSSSLAPERIQSASNASLAPEIVVINAVRAPDGFDARFSATARDYRYRIRTAPTSDPFTARFEWHRPGALAVVPMRAAARAFLGEHDFTSFCRHPGKDRSTVRRVTRLSVVRGSDVVEIGIHANAFLHQMVRAIVGMLVVVGDGKREPDGVARILAARDRSAAAQIAPAQGLTLERVVYGRRALNDDEPRA
jgi:tRNA pseudouridine38-40 synthase